MFEWLTSADHQMGSCELTENNIVAHDRFTESPAACQVKCREEADCGWFTHYDTSCYMLDHCGDITKWVPVTLTASNSPVQV